MSAPLPLLKSLQESVRRAADQQVGREMHSGLHAALTAARAVDPQQREEFRQLVGRIVPQVQSACGAGQLAIWLGSAVEAGCPAEPTTGPLVDGFIRWSQTLVTDPDGQDPPAAEECVAGLQMIGQSLVAHLSTERTLRNKVAANKQLRSELDRIEHLTPGAWWLRGLLTQQSGLMRVVHTDHGCGAELSYTNINNCFHLLTLVQGQLEGSFPGSQPSDPHVQAVARGEAWDQVSDEAWWDYLTVAEDRTLQLIDGQTSPDCLKSKDGVQLIFVRQPASNRLSWDGGFFAPVLSASPPDVKLKRLLSADEVAALTADITF